MKITPISAYKSNPQVLDCKSDPKNNCGNNAMQPAFEGGGFLTKFFILLTSLGISVGAYAQKAGNTAVKATEKVAVSVADTLNSEAAAIAKIEAGTAKITAGAAKVEAGAAKVEAAEQNIAQAGAATRKRLEALLDD